MGPQPRGRRTFDRRIEHELAAADAVVVVPRQSMQSNWVLSEAMVGFESNRLVPVALDARIAPPLPFNRLHGIAGGLVRGARAPRLDGSGAGRPTLESRGMRVRRRARPTGRHP